MVFLLKAPIEQDLKYYFHPSAVIDAVRKMFVLPTSSAKKLYGVQFNHSVSNMHAYS